jgi:hypothetical protein
MNEQVKVVNLAVQVGKATMTDSCEWRSEVGDGLSGRVPPYLWAFSGGR